MAMPRKLKYLNTFLDGVSYLGVIESVTLPKLTRKLENYRGGGMSGSAPVDFGLDDDALAMEISLGGFLMIRSGRFMVPSVPGRCCAMQALTSGTITAKPWRWKLRPVSR